MRVAIAAMKSDISSEVSSKAARAPFYLVFDENGELLESIENPYAEVGGGAAPKASRLLAENGIDRVVAEEFGAKFKALLEGAGIEPIQKSGEVQKALRELI